MSNTFERLSAALADHYRIELEIGAGGMATVYLAHDLKHDRKVAIKVLKPELAAVLGADRFIAEIRTTAALQHPHILPLFDSGTADGFLFYVMPFIDGETLRRKLDRETQLGIDEAVKMATSVADALDYAHRRGVIHRDIKPENILLHEGRPMVADFGIALAVSAAAGGRMTETGLSLGTPHYMSPEQATAAKEISARSDIYSLASVLYEMLGGNPPHTGVSAQQIIMKIITEEPAAVSSLRKSVPPNVAAAVARALEKLPADRFESAKAFADALTNPAFAITATGTSHLAVATAQGWQGWLRNPRSWAALLAVIVLGAIAMPARNRARDGGTAVVQRFLVQASSDSMVLGVGGGLRDPVVTNDGRFLAFVARKAAGSVLYARRLDSFELTEITDNAQGVFLSPDDRTIGFFRESEVWKVDLAEPVPTRIGAIPEVKWDINWVVWHPDGRILITASRGLWALGAAGAEPVLLVAADPAAGESFEYISLLPDGRILLVVGDNGPGHIEIISPDGKERRRMPGGVHVIDDIMLMIQADQLRATFFDARSLQPTGSPVVLPDVPRGRIMRPGRSMAWVDGSGRRNLEPVWVTTSGAATALGVPPSSYRWPRVSPDLSRIVGGSFDGLASYSVRTGASARIQGQSEPVWSFDGRFIFAARGNRPEGGILRQIADGSRAPDTLLALDRGDAWPTDASPDGKWLVYYGATLGAGTGADATDPNDIMFLDLTTKQSRRLRLPGEQRVARFSPDGHWIAYQSTEAGEAGEEDIFVRPWPALDAVYQVSTDGGFEPLWAPGGKSLYYRKRADVIEVPITVRDGVFEPAAPRVLFTGNYANDSSGDQSWDIGSGGRFLMLRPLPGEHIDLRVTLNWIDDVRQRLQRAQRAPK